MKNLLHYGLQRSGTNFLESLLKENFQIRMLNSDSDRKHPVQKHFRLYNDKSIIAEPQYNNDLIFKSYVEYEKSLELSKNIDGVLVITKDPYSWYISYLNWAKKCNWPKVDFHYIEEYNRFYNKWMEFHENESKISFVRYIDLLCNTEQELDRIRKAYNLSDRLIRKIFGKKLELTKVSQSNTFSDKKQFFYKNKEYLNKISNTEMQTINSLLDTQLMSKLKYDIE